MHGSGMSQRGMGQRDIYVLESEIWVQIPAAPLKSCMTLASGVSFLSVSVFIFRTA